MQKQSGELASDVHDQLVFILPNYSVCFGWNSIEVMDLRKIQMEGIRVCMPYRAVFMEGLVTSSIKVLVTIPCIRSWNLKLYRGILDIQGV